MSLTADVVYGFVGSVLAPRFDEPTKLAKFHKELWEYCCLDNSRIAIAAPRGHSKSTSVTLGYLLAALLFRDKQYAIVVSNTYTQASQFLGDIKNELLDNEDLIALFGKVTLKKDTEALIIAEMEDGYKFRVEAKGSEQEPRGLKWEHKRPDLLLCDDFENSEIVNNKERRIKFRENFLKSWLPMLSTSGKTIVVGTILHMDSLLERLLADPTWVSVRYAAHNEDFSEILWPERFDRERLEEIRYSYISQGMPEGYSQEYLNYPIDESTAYFKRDDFRWFDVDEIDYDRLNYYAAVDFAISEKERSDYTVIAVVGIDEKNKMYVVDIQRGRWDAKEIIDNMLDIQVKWTPEIFTVEEGMIKKSLGPFLKDEMMSSGIFLNLNPMVPVKDKQTRARSIQARLKQGSVYFNGDAEWYPALEQELVRFPKDVHDDQVDALAWIGLTLDSIIPGRTQQEFEDDVYDDEFTSFYEPTGRCASTGY